MRTLSYKGRLQSLRGLISCCLGAFCMEGTGDNEWCFGYQNRSLQVFVLGSALVPGRLVQTLWDSWS